MLKLWTTLSDPSKIHLHVSRVIMFCLDVSCVTNVLLAAKQVQDTFDNFTRL